MLDFCFIMKNIKYKLLPLLLLLNACIAAIPAKDLTATDVSAIYPIQKAFQNALCTEKVNVEIVDDVMGAMTNENFKDALTMSFTTSGYSFTSTNDCKYILNAKITKIERPFAAFNMNVKASIHYEIIRIKDNKTLVNEDVTIGHEIGYFEQTDGTERLRMAIAKAVSGNITHFLRYLSILNVNK